MDDEAADPPKRPPPPAPKPLKRDLANESSSSGMRGRGSFLYIALKTPFYIHIANFTCPMLPLLSHANESSGTGMRQSFLSGSFLYIAHFTYQMLPLFSHATRKGGI